MVLVSRSAARDRRHRRPGARHRRRRFTAPVTGAALTAPGLVSVQRSVQIDEVQFDQSRHSTIGKGTVRRSCSPPDTHTHMYGKVHNRINGRLTNGVSKKNMEIQKYPEKFHPCKILDSIIFNIFFLFDVGQMIWTFLTFFTPLFQAPF